MTPSTIKRLGRCYENMVGYDPFKDDPTISPATVLDTLREMRTADTLHPDDPASYVGPTLTSAALRRTR